MCSVILITYHQGRSRTSFILLRWRLRNVMQLVLNWPCLPRYELVNKFPHKLTFPGPVVQQKENKVVEQITRIEAQTLSVDREMAENAINDTTVSYCRAGMSCDSVEPLCSDADVTAYNLHGNRVNKQTDLGNIGVSSTVSAFPVKSGDLAEVTRPQSCLLYTSPSPRDGLLSRMPSSA